MNDAICIVLYVRHLVGLCPCYIPWHIHATLTYGSAWWRALRYWWIIALHLTVNSLIWTLVWLAPGGTQNSEFVCFYVLLQTIGQMVKIDPTTVLRLIDWLIDLCQIWQASSNLPVNTCMRARGPLITPWKKAAASQQCVGNEDAMVQIAACPKGKWRKTPQCENFPVDTSKPSPAGRQKAMPAKAWLLAHGSYKCQRDPARSNLNKPSQPQYW